MSSAANTEASSAGNLPNLRARFKLDAPPSNFCGYSQESIGVFSQRKEYFLEENTFSFKKRWCSDKNIVLLCLKIVRGAFDSAKNHKRQRRKRQSVTAKRGKS